MAPPFPQFLFPEPTTARKVLHTQHARLVMFPTAPLTIPSSLESASRHGPSDFRTINTDILATFSTYTKPTTTSLAESTMTTFTSVTASMIPPSFSTFSSQPIPIVASTSSHGYEPTATFATITRPNTIATAKSTETATVVPTPTQHTDLSAVDAQNLEIDKRKMELFLAIFGPISLIITLAVLFWCLTGSRRWRRRTSTRPVEQMEMAGSRYTRRYPCASNGYHAASRQPSDSIGEQDSRSLRGSAIGSQIVGPVVYPSHVRHDRHYGPGHYDTCNRRYFGGV